MWFLKIWKGKGIEKWVLYTRESSKRKLLEIKTVNIGLKFFWLVTKITVSVELMRMRLRRLDLCG